MESTPAQYIDIFKRTKHHCESLGWKLGDQFYSVALIHGLPESMTSTAQGLLARGKDLKLINCHITTF